MPSLCPDLDHIPPQSMTKFFQIAISNGMYNLISWLQKNDK